MKHFIIDSKHPESREGEIYLGYFNDCYFKSIGWKTKRKGVDAFYQDNTPINDKSIYPVFVRCKELEEAGIEIKDKK